MFARADDHGALAFYTPNLKGGGAERMVIALAGGMADRGYRVTLLVDYRRGALADVVPSNIAVRELAASGSFRDILAGVWQALTRCGRFRYVILRRVLTSRKATGKLRALPALMRYLRADAPQAVICSLGFTAFHTLWAREITGIETRVLVREENFFSAKLTAATNILGQRRRRTRMRRLMRELYPYIDRVIPVSQGIRDDLYLTIGLPPEAMTPIYNPVVSEKLLALAAERCDHPWLIDEKSPVVLAVGRLNAQKDFPTLVDAFVRVRRELDARLIILGEGPDRSILEKQLRELKLTRYVDLPGWAKNPYAYMTASSLFVLSSRYEGLPTALIEAMACGCPVIATDCPSGPAEILDNGRLAPLVDVGDNNGLAATMVAQLTQPPDTGPLKRRAEAFTQHRIVDRYIELIDSIGL